MEAWLDSGYIFCDECWSMFLQQQVKAYHINLFLVSTIF